MKDIDNYNPGDIFQVNHDFGSYGSTWRGVYCEVIRKSKNVVVGGAISGNRIGRIGGFFTNTIRKVA